MATLIINLSQEEDVRRIASVLTGSDLEWVTEGNTLELTMFGPDVHRRIKRLYDRDFPPDPNQPLPGQLPLLPGDGQ